jgi:hypothetical protein
VQSSVTQNAVNDNDFSFDVLERTLKKVAEDHNFVGTIGNTILDSGVTVYLQRVTMFLIIHGTMQT